MAHVETTKEIHKFDNGVRVYRRYLIPQQIERYTKTNLHEPEEEALFLGLLEKIDVTRECFVNIGAAIGYYVILAHRVRSGLEIHGFEPLTAHKAQLRENLALNEIAENQVSIHDEAISSKNGMSKFVCQSFGSSLVEETITKINIGPEYTQTMVPTITLDTFAAGIDKKIGLAQMDVQAFELDVLKGAERLLQKKDVRFWLVGTHSRNLHQACRQVLTAYGYRILHDQFETRDQPDGIICAGLD